MTAQVPHEVAALAAKARMTPIAWKIHPDRVVIVFQQGPKLTFERKPTDSVEPPAAKVIDVADGVDKNEASLAGQALAARKRTKKDE